MRVITVLLASAPAHTIATCISSQTRADLLHPSSTLVSWDLFFCDCKTSILFFSFSKRSKETFKNLYLSHFILSICQLQLEPLYLVLSLPNSLSQSRFPPREPHPVMSFRLSIIVVIFVQADEKSQQNPNKHYSNRYQLPSSKYTQHFDFPLSSNIWI